MQLRSFSTIAVIQTAFLGDAALSLFLVEQLREANPQARIIVVTTPAAASLMRHAASVDEVVIYDKRGADAGVAGILRMTRQLRRLRVDLVFGLQRSVRTSLVAALSGARMSIGFAHAAASFLYDCRVPWDLHIHETERNRTMLRLFSDAAEIAVPRTVRFVDTPYSSETRQTSTSPEPAIPQPTMTAPIHRGRIVLAPGSVWATKRWPESSWIALASALVQEGYAVELLGGPDDHALCTRIAHAAGAYCPSSPTALPHSLLRLRAADVLVTNDSAPTHLAALVGTRTVTIFGSTVPGFGFGPRGPRDAVIENTEAACRPCGRHGRTSCPLGTMVCMTGISVQTVLNVVRDDRAMGSENFPVIAPAADR